jgi:hypothetical protein
MRLIFDIIKKITFKPQKIDLGRWKIEYCDKKINKKVAYSNHDHCGTCGQDYLKNNKKFLNK